MTVSEQREHDDDDTPAGHIHERDVAHVDRDRVGEELLHRHGRGLGDEPLRIVARAPARGVPDPGQALPAQLHLRLRLLAVDDEVHVLVADAVIHVRGLECVQDLQQCRLIKGRGALCPFARTIGLVSLTIARWPRTREDLDSAPATYTTRWDATPPRCAAPEQGVMRSTTALRLQPHSGKSNKPLTVQCHCL